MTPAGGSAHAESNTKNTRRGSKSASSSLRTGVEKAPTARFGSSKRSKDRRAKDRAKDGTKEGAVDVSALILKVNELVEYAKASNKAP